MKLDKTEKLIFATGGIPMFCRKNCKKKQTSFCLRRLALSTEFTMNVKNVAVMMFSQ